MARFPGVPLEEETQQTRRFPGVPLVPEPTVGEPIRDTAIDAIAGPSAIGQGAARTLRDLFGIDQPVEVEPLQQLPRRGDLGTIAQGSIAGLAGLGDFVNEFNPFNIAARATGIVGPEDTIRGGLAARGIGFENLGQIDPRDRPLAAIGQALGGGAGFAAPLRVGRAAVTAARSVPAAAGSTRALSRAAGKLPAPPPAPLPASLDSASVVGGGLGAGVAEQVDPGDPVSAFLGELGGAVASPAVLALRIFAVPLSSLSIFVRQQLARARGTATGLFSASAAERRAAVAVVRNLREAGEDPDTIARALDNIRGNRAEVPRFTSDVEANSIALTALRNRISKNSPGLQQAFQAQNDQALEAMTATAEQFARSGDRTALEKAGNLYKQVFDRTFAAQRDTAVARAREAASRLGTNPAQASRESGRILSDTIEEAEKAARAFERRVWAPIDKQAQTPANAVTSALADARSQVLEGRQVLDPIAERAIDAISGGVGKTGAAGIATVDELLRIRSDALNLARQFESAGNANGARLARDVASSVLDDLASVPGTENARIVSRELNDTLTRTFAGDLLAVARTGAERITPGTASAVALAPGREGAQRLERADELRAAAGFDPQAQSSADLSQIPDLPDAGLSAAAAARREAAQAALEQQRTAQLATDVDPLTGRVRAGAVAEELRAGQSLELPQSQASGQRALDIELAAQRAESRTAERLVRLGDEADSELALLTNQPGRSSTEVVETVLRGTNAEGRFKRLVNAARNRRLPAETRVAAEDDLRAGVVANALNPARKPDGQIDFEALRLGLFSEVGGRPGLMSLLERNGLVSARQVQQNREFLSRAVQVQRRLADKDIRADLLSDPNPVFSFLARVVGARAGAAANAALGGRGTIQIPGAGARLLESLSKRLPGFRTQEVIARELASPSSEFIALLNEAARLKGPTLPTGFRQRFSRVTSGLLNAGLLTKDEFTELEAEADAVLQRPRQ